MTRTSKHAGIKPQPFLRSKLDLNLELVSPSGCTITSVWLCPVSDIFSSFLGHIHQSGSSILATNFVSFKGSFESRPLENVSSREDQGNCVLVSSMYRVMEGGVGGRGGGWSWKRFKGQAFQSLRNIPFLPLLSGP